MSTEIAEAIKTTLAAVFEDESLAAQTTEHP